MLCMYVRVVAVHFFVALKFLLLHKMELKLQMPRLEKYIYDSEWVVFCSCEEKLF